MTKKKRKVARIILRKRNLSRKLRATTSNTQTSSSVYPCTSEARKDEELEDVSEEFVSGIEVTWSMAMKHNLFSSQSSPNIFISIMPKKV